MVGLLGMIGQGLSAAGGAVSQYAGDIGVMQMKAEYEKQSQVLANQLATQRETTLEGQRETFQAGQTAKQQAFTTSERVAGEQFKVGPGAQAAKDLAQYTSNLSVAANRQEAMDAIGRIPLMQDAQHKADVAAASDPQWIQAKRTITDATATPEQRAQAAFYVTEATKNNIQSTALAYAQQARTDLASALASGDQDKIHDAQSRLFVAEYSAHDEVARASALAQAANSARLNWQTLQSEYAKQKGDIIGAITPAQKAMLDNLQNEVTQAKSDYDTAYGQQISAAKSLPSFTSVLGGGAPPPPAGGPGSSRAKPARPKTKQEAGALPRGAWFVDPSGSLIQRQ